MFSYFKARLGQLAGRDDAQTSSHVAEVSPSTPFYAVGDVHGCKDLLERLLQKFDVASSDGETLVFLGDYIDRGAQSRSVLTLLFERAQRRTDATICLMGNHERMMLDFIDDPVGHGMIWLKNGGIETLASFGIPVRSSVLDADTGVQLAKELAAKMPSGMQEWLRGLPLTWASGNVHCVHAGMAPNRHANNQRPETLLWGHPEFAKAEREDGIFVVHGHTIVERATICGRRISLDTGAYRTGRLSGARLTSGECIFFTAD